MSLEINQVATFDMECKLQVCKGTSSIPVENKYSITTHSVPRSCEDIEGIEALQGIYDVHTFNMHT